MPKPATSAVPKKRVNKKPRLSPNGYQLPDPIQKGEVLTDLHKNKWKLGQSIGLGGFGEIYLASDDITKAPGPDCRYVIKIEPHNNGPLFSELHCYLRIAKEELVKGWMQSKKLKFLGMPLFIGSGSHDYKGTKYRFMVIPRFGDDLQKLLEADAKRFSLKTVATLGIKTLDILEYMHNHGYIHADIKGSNMVLGYGDTTNEKVYLVDFGLACRYQVDGVHKPYEEDPRKAHDGTIEFTSRDAHVGAHSRRGDLEILGYNMIWWLSGKLPWDNCLKSPEAVQQSKLKSMANIPQLLKECFKKANPCPALQQYLEYVVKLKFDEEPNYEHCRRILRKAVPSYDGKLEIGKILTAPKTRKWYSSFDQSDVEIDMEIVDDASSSDMQQIVVRKSESEDNENSPDHKLQKVQRSTRRKPCAPAQINKLRRSPNTRGKDDKKDVQSSIDNPTPAMLAILEKRQKQQQELGKKKNKVDG